MPAKPPESSPLSQIFKSLAGPIMPDHFIKVLCCQQYAGKYPEKEEEENAPMGKGYLEGPEFSEFLDRKDKPARNKRKVNSKDSILWYSERPFTFLVENPKFWVIQFASPETLDWLVVPEYEAPWVAIKSCLVPIVLVHCVQLEVNDPRANQEDSPTVQKDLVSGEYPLDYFVVCHHLALQCCEAKRAPLRCLSKPSVRATIIFS